MGKNKKNSALPYNLRLFVAHKEKERDKEVEMMKASMASALLIHDHTLNAVQSFIHLLTNFVGHDLKNEIHNVDGIISNLTPTDVSEKEIETLKSCIDHMRLTLEDFNIISDEKEADEFNLGRLMSSLEMLHRNNFKREKINFQINYENASKEIVIKQHFRKILQLFNNLIINSIKALKCGVNKQIFIKINANDERITLYICDNGCGILKENREKIFTPYFTTTGGSGIGLTHVKHVLDEIGGEISLVESNDSYNTIFELIIPLRYETHNSNS